MSKNKIVITVIVILVITITGFFYFKKFSSQISKIDNPNNVNKSVADKNENISKKKSCESGWNYYRQDVLGIEFCYPQSWGEPKTDPIEKLTRISQMEKDFKQLNIYYNNAIKIVFDSNSSEIGAGFKEIKFFIFNDKYSITDRQSYDYYYDGTAGNVTNLAKNDNVCSYKIEYDDRYNKRGSASDSISTIEDSCSNGVKMFLSENREGFSYTYDLHFFAFKKLKNEYFNNALISYPFDVANQVREKISSLDDFFNTKMTTDVVDGLPKKNKDQLSEEKATFEKFVASISSFNPVEKGETKFETVAGENPDMTLIRKYYWFLENGKLSDAYAISTGGAKDFSEYQTWYGNIYAAKPQQINKTGEHIYEFYVDYQDHNNPETKYHVIMDVNGNKIDTQLAEEITSDEVKSGNNIVFTKKKSGKNYVILNKNGKEIIVDQGISDYNNEYSNIGEVKHFGNIKFSPSGKYMMYGMSGWEWGVRYVYDISREKNVLDDVESDVLEFSPDEKYLFSCSSAGMASGPGGKIYRIPDFGKPMYEIPQEMFKIDSSTEYLNVDCSYDSASNSVNYRLNNDGSSERQNDKNINYNLGTSKITIK
jgi:hypothetical protein